LKILNVTANGQSNSLGPLFNITGTWDGKSFTYGTLGWEPSLAQYVLDIQWIDGGKTYAAVANVTAPSGNWYAGDLQLTAWWHDSSQVVRQAYGQQTGGPHPWDGLVLSTARLVAARLE
jgi:hypothetical protein